MSVKIQGKNRGPANVSHALRLSSCHFNPLNNKPNSAKQKVNNIYYPAVGTFSCPRFLTFKFLGILISYFDFMHIVTCDFGYVRDSQVNRYYT